MNPQLDFPNPTEGETPSRKTRNKLALALGWLVLLLALAGAAFVAGRYLNPAALLGSRDSGLQLSMGGGQERISLELNQAEELPDSEPEVSGIFTRRADNSIFVGTGQATFAVTKDGASSSYDGPVVEVVVTNETTIYRDVTLAGGVPMESGTVDQKLAPGSIDEISENNMMTVWGRKAGDRVIAEVLVYSQPTIFSKPGS